MGVRGLTSFIARDEKRYLKPIKLKNCYLVIDGNCVASHLFKWCSKRDSAFGGDYDEYHAVVKNFFTVLKKCSITPIVIFDGGYEQKKIKTVLTRLKSKLLTLKISFTRGFTESKFFPLFMRQIFCEVLMSLNITQIQCEFEADGEIAALGRVLDCPVLSYDSDFYIYDVSYIPFSTVELALPNGASSGLPCSIYKLEEFLKEFPGLQKCHLPLVATLLGNDFVNANFFLKFFHQIPLTKSKNMTNAERRIFGLLKWMTQESEASAIEKIKSHIGKSRHDQLSRAIEMTKANYDVKSHCVIEKICGKLVIEGPPYVTTLLEKPLVQMLVSCELPSFIINLITLRKYFMPLQVEDISKASCHSPSFPIINAIDKLLCQDQTNTDPLTLYIRVKGKIIEQPIPVNEQTNRSNGKFDRAKYLYLALGLDDHGQACVKTLLPECHLFMAAFLCWCKCANPTVFHVHTLLLGYLACQAKNKVGYFRQKQSLSSTEDISKIIEWFAPHRKTTEAARSTYEVATVHVFNMFQSILYHAGVLNTLLGSPFKLCRLADSYSGTLLYNLFGLIGNRTNVMKTLLNVCPVDSFQNLYGELYDKFYRYFPETPKCTILEKKRRKRKHAKKIAVEIESSGEEEQEEEVDQYDDLCNKFSILSAKAS